MPMAFLEHLARVDLPIKVSDQAQIHKLRVLLAAGHVYATVPLPYFRLDGTWCQDCATVHRITPLGYKVLRYFATTDNAWAFTKDRAS